MKPSSEIWRQVTGFEGRYDVSNHGRVRIVNYRSTGKYKIMKCSKCAQGYPRVGLHAGDRHRDTHVHSLVAEAFCGSRPEGYHVNHKNGVKTNNFPDNLEFCSAADNLRHALSTGLICTTGEKNPNVALNEESVKTIWSKLKRGASLTELARAFLVTKSQIYNIREGKSWGWLTRSLEAA